MKREPKGGSIERVVGEPLNFKNVTTVPVEQALSKRRLKTQHSVECAYPSSDISGSDGSVGERLQWCSSGRKFFA